MFLNEREKKALYLLPYLLFLCGRSVAWNRQVIGIDIDSQSLEIATMNAEDLEVLSLY